MQPVLADPRGSDDPDIVTGLIRDSAAVKVGRGLELVDRDLNVLDEVTELEGGTIRRNSYATLHGLADLPIARELDWGAGLVRPYITLASGLGSAKFRLGAYYLPTPRRDLGRSPELYQTQCFDYLQGLDARIGESYGIAAGTPVLEHVAGILDLQGYTRYVIDQSAAAETVPSPGYAKPITDDPTWLGVVNDLLAMIGYAGIWSDWEGRLRVHPYLRPVERANEWYYDTTSDAGMLQTGRQVDDDYYDAPNAWTFYRNNLEEGVQPVPGNGLFRYVNQSQGRTSVEARGDRVVPAPSVGLDAANQVALEAAAQARIDADMALTRRVYADVDLMPLHWHFDRVWVDDPAIGPPFNALCTEWQIPLAGRTMQQTWAVLE